MLEKLKLLKKELLKNPSRDYSYVLIGGEKNIEYLRFYPDPAKARPILGVVVVVVRFCPVYHC